MSSKVSSRDPRPPYIQIADGLRADIDAGTLKPGDKLASGRALAEEYGVAAMTVQHAIRLLREEGLLVTWQGRGVFVADPADGEVLVEGDPHAAMLRRLDQLTDAVRDLDRRVASVESDKADS